MEFVKQNGVYRGVLLTTDQAVQPEVAAWPDDNIEEADVIATIAGEPYGGTKTVEPASEVGQHIITLDCSGVAAGSVIQISGEYYIDLIRYTWAEEIYVSADVAVQAIAEADQRFVLDGGVYKLAVYEKGTATEILTRKNIKQLDGTDMTDPTTQVFGGFQEP